MGLRDENWKFRNTSVDVLENLEELMKYHAKCRRRSSVNQSLIDSDNPNRYEALEVFLAAF